MDGDGWRMLAHFASDVEGELHAPRCDTLRVGCPRMAIRKVCGIETEYGISVAGRTRTRSRPRPC